MDLSAFNEHDNGLLALTHRDVDTVGTPDSMWRDPSRRSTEYEEMAGNI